MKIIKNKANEAYEILFGNKGKILYHKACSGFMKDEIKRTKKIKLAFEKLLKGKK